MTAVTGTARNAEPRPPRGPPVPDDRALGRPAASILSFSPPLSFLSFPLVPLFPSLFLPLSLSLSLSRREPRSSRSVDRSVENSRTRRWKSRIRRRSTRIRRRLGREHVGRGGADFLPFSREGPAPPFSVSPCGGEKRRCANDCYLPRSESAAGLWYTGSMVSSYTPATAAPPSLPRHAVPSNVPIPRLSPPSRSPSRSSTLPRPCTHNTEHRYRPRRYRALPLSLPTPCSTPVDRPTDRPIHADLCCLAGPQGRIHPSHSLLRPLSSSWKILSRRQREGERGREREREARTDRNCRFSILRVERFVRLSGVSGIWLREGDAGRGARAWKTQPSQTLLNV